MKLGRDEVLALIDMTGSMQPLTEDSIGGFNRFLEDQKNIPRECTFSLILFNSASYNKIYDRTNIHSIQKLTKDIYKPDNTTPLLDSVGRAIDELGEALKNTSEHERPENIIICILTDGEENASHKFTRQQIFDKITHQQDVYKWKFIYLGANQDSFAEAGSIGIPQINIKNYVHDAQGISVGYASMSSFTSSHRTSNQDNFTTSGDNIIINDQQVSANP